MSDADKKAIYEQAGLSGRLGFGKHPAVIAVDMQVGFTQPHKSPLASIMDTEIEFTNTIIETARVKSVPIFFTAIGYESTRQSDGGLWVEKNPVLRQLKVGTELVNIDPRMSRKPGDVTIIKQYASAFFATHLAPTLTTQGIDTLIVTGCTTSGCIRATVIDAISYGFRPIIPIEAVGDRAKEPHEANLFDMDRKYGDVIPVSELLQYMKSL